MTITGDDDADSPAVDVSADVPVVVPVDIPVVVIGAGQAGLSASYHLTRAGIEHVLLDGGDAPGGAWRHRWPSLTMGSVNGVHDLPGQKLGDVDPEAPAARVVPAYFADYERRWELPVVRPWTVRAVRRDPRTPGHLADRLLVEAVPARRPPSEPSEPSEPYEQSPGLRRTWAARAVLNATGTWTRPFWPSYPGRATFAGRQLHTADYRGAEELAGTAVVVVGGGISAVQLLVEVADVARTTWLTRRPPVFRDDVFDEQAGRDAVARVAARVEAGLPPTSVVSATGLIWSPALRRAQQAGVLARYPVMDAVVPDGVRWDEPVGPGHARHLPADVLLWCTGFRAALDHLAPLHLRGPGGGIRIDGSRVLAEPRLWLLGYGPSASTVGASRAARDAVRQVRCLLGQS